jgi:protein-tyrosine phosphatase
MANFWQRLFGSNAATASTYNTVSPLASLQVDMHSHLLPGLDDGAETVADSLELLRELRTLGFRKLIMTPHIMGDFYKNTPEGIRAALAELQAATIAAGLDDMTLECAAEYYLDE